MNSARPGSPRLYFLGWPSASKILSKSPWWTNGTTKRKRKLIKWTLIWCASITAEKLVYIFIKKNWSLDFIVAVKGTLFTGLHPQTCLCCTQHAAIAACHSALSCSWKLKFRVGIEQSTYLVTCCRRIGLRGTLELSFILTVKSRRDVLSVQCNNCFYVVGRFPYKTRECKLY